MIRQIPLKGQQTGAALIVVMMMFAIITVIAVEIMYRQDRFRARTQNLMDWDMRYQYAMAAEGIAVRALLDDLEEGRANGLFIDDCVDDNWAISLPPTPYEDAFISASVQDLQGRFNLNWLVTVQGDQYIRNDEWRERLATLFATTINDPGKAQRLSHELADWIDSNTLVDGVEGAEDAEYRFRRTPNLPVAHESELRALLSATAEDFPDEPDFWGLLSALPADHLININTAPLPVLDAVLSDTVGPEGTQAIHQLRQEGAIETLDVLFEALPFSELEEDQENQLRGMLGLQSAFFQVMIEVLHQGRSSRLVTRIHRPQQGESRVYSRQLTPRMNPLEPACNPLYNDPAEGL